MHMLEPAAPESGASLPLISHERVRLAISRRELDRLLVDGLHNQEIDVRLKDAFSLPKDDPNQKPPTRVVFPYA